MNRTPRTSLAAGVAIDIAQGVIEVVANMIHHLLNSFAAAVLLLATVIPATRSASADTVDHFYVGNLVPPDDFLALRDLPSARAGKRIAKIATGALIDVLYRQSDGWWRVRVITSGEEGWALSRNGDQQWILCCKATPQFLSPSENEGAKYSIDGVEVGAVIDPQSGQFKQYHCRPSNTFPEHTWCQRTAMERGKEGDFAATNVFLQSADGSVAYVSRAIKPAHFSPGDIDAEISRLSRRYGTPRILKSRPGQAPSGVIAYWGSLVLAPLDADAVNLIATGHPSGKGFLFDFLDNFRTSAQHGLEIYSVSGGRGYVWSASFDDAGTGVLSLAAMDSATVGAPTGSQAANASIDSLTPSTSKPTSQAAPPSIPSLPDSAKVNAAPTADASAAQSAGGPGFETFARLTEFPSACAAVKKMGALATWPRGWANEKRDPFSGRYSASDICKEALECLPALSVRLKPLFDYLRTRPLLYAALKRVAAPSQGMSVDSAIEIIGSKVDLSVTDCSFFVTTLDRLMARNGADPGHISPAPFEYLQAASQNLISDLRTGHEAAAASYSEWLPYARHYTRAAQLAAQKQKYEDAFGGPDIETILNTIQNFNQEMTAANTFRATLIEQGSKLAELSERLNGLAEQAAQEQISKIVKQNTATEIQSTKTEIDDLGKTPAPERGDVLLQLTQFENRTMAFQNDLKVAQDKLDTMSQQGAKLAELSDRLTDLAGQAAKEPLSKLVKPDEPAVIEKLKAEIDHLAKAPVPERGDVSRQLTQFETRTNDFQDDLKVAQDKLNAMLQQGTKLAELSERLANFARQAAEEPLSKLVKPNESAAIEKLKAEIDRLAKAPVPERGDVSGQIAQFESGMYVVENDLKEAQEKQSQTSASKDSDLKDEKDKDATLNRDEHVEVSQSRMTSGIGMITHISIRSRESEIRIDRIELNRGNCKVWDVMGGDRTGRRERRWRASAP